MEQCYERHLTCVSGALETNVIFFFTNFLCGKNTLKINSLSIINCSLKVNTSIHCTWSTFAKLTLSWVNVHREQHIQPFADARSHGWGHGWVGWVVGLGGVGRGVNRSAGWRVGGSVGGGRVSIWGWEVQGAKNFHLWGCTSDMYRHSIDWVNLFSWTNLY